MIDGTTQIDFGPREYVHESRLGVWFLGTQTWATHVLTRALNDLEPLIKNRRSSYPVILDAGCGWGRSFKLLKERFLPTRLISIDIDPEMIGASRRAIAPDRIEVEFRCESSARIGLSSQSVDMIFCHQTFHHVVNQEGAIREFQRLLKPGGILLFAESTRAYIHSWLIRLLFRHDMDVQKSADEYVRMIEAAGFTIDRASISYPYLWWSRRDLGVLERWFGIRPPSVREETLINLIAVRT